MIEGKTSKGKLAVREKNRQSRWINIFRLKTMEINTTSYRSTYPPAIELASSSLLLSENKQYKENKIA